MVSERRIFDRFQARFPAKFKDTRGDFGQSVFLRDASADGVNILTKDRMFFNDCIDLEIALPDGQEPLILSGRVRWVRPANPAMWDVGIKLDRVNFMKIQRIFKLSLVS